MRPMEHGADVNITALVILERQLSAGIVFAYSNGRLADISAFESFALVKSEDQGTMKFAFKGWHGGIELELGDAVESAQADIRHKPGCDTIASVVPHLVRDAFCSTDGMTAFVLRNTLKSEWF